MSNAVQELDWATLGRRIVAGAFRERRPIAGSIALTYRCNLDCRHCYLRHSRDADEMSTRAWLDVLDELEQSGCLWLLLTGGEPLLHPGFADIYRGAKQRGMLVTVFTNGTLVDDSIVELLRAWPPHVVEISLYGHSRAVYGEVTGRADMHGAALLAARRLARSGVRLRLKTPVLRQNVAELARLRRFARRLGVAFRNDPSLSPTLTGSTEPCSARLDHEDLVHFDVRDSARLAGWADFLASRRNLPSRSSMFNCGAGVTSFAIDPAGLLSLCAYDRPVFDLKEGSFAEGWQGAIRQRRSLALPRNHPCRDCRDQIFCGVCAPLARMETGSEVGVPRALCAQGHERGRAIRRRLSRLQEHHDEEARPPRSECARPRIPRASRGTPAALRKPPSHQGQGAP